MLQKKEKKLISTTEAAEVTGFSRMHIFRLIKSGKIPARKVGNTYLIDIADLGVYTDNVTGKEEQEIENAVEKVFDEYGETIKKLGEE